MGLSRGRGSWGDTGELPTGPAKNKRKLSLEGSGGRDRRVPGICLQGILEWGGGGWGRSRWS